MITVSVVVAVRDGAATIGAAVASVLAQTLNDLEIVLVDDTSQDGTADVARAVADGDPRLVVLSLDRNRGPAGARNHGISAAHGRYVAVLDADDAYAPDRLETLVARVRETDAEMVCDDLLLVDAQTGEELGPMFGDDLADPLDIPAFVTGDLPDPRAPRCGTGFLKPLISRDFLLTRGLVYPEGMRFAEDYAFALSCLLAGARWRTVARPLYRYALGSDSLTARHGATDLERLLAFDEARLAELPRDADPRIVEALRQHEAVVARRAGWARFVEDYKAGRLSAALRAAGRDRRVLGHVLKNCMAHLRERGLPRPPTPLRRASGGR